MSSFSMYSFLLVFWIDESQSNMLDLLWFLKPSCLLDRRVWSLFLQKNFKVHSPLIYFVCLSLLLFSILASFLFWGINYPTYNQFSKKLSYFVWNRLYNWHLLMTYFFNYKKIWLFESDFWYYFYTSLSTSTLVNTRVVIPLDTIPFWSVVRQYKFPLFCRITSHFHIAIPASILSCFCAWSKHYQSQDRYQWKQKSLFNKVFHDFYS